MAKCVQTKFRNKFARTLLNLQFAGTVFALRSPGFTGLLETRERSAQGRATSHAAFEGKIHPNTYETWSWTGESVCHWLVFGRHCLPLSAVLHVNGFLTGVTRQLRPLSSQFVFRTCMYLYFDGPGSSDLRGLAVRDVFFTFDFSAAGAKKNITVTRTPLRDATGA